MTSPDFGRQLEGYKLTTAHILYHLPDFPALLQSYVWQEYDLAPDYPELFRFLDFWRETIEGPIHSVRIAQKGIIAPAQLRTADGIFTMH